MSLSPTPVTGRITSRRLVLASAVAGGLVALSGCSREGPASSPIPTPSPTPTPPPPPPPPPTVDRAALTAQLEAHLTERGGTMGLMVHDHRSGETFEWRSFTNQTLSTIKVLILVACFHRCEELGETLTKTQHGYARRMIQSSNNEATNALLEWVGEPRVLQVAQLLGMDSTTFQGGTAGGAPEWWGYSTSTPSDMVKLVDAVSVGTNVINEDNRAYIRDLMTGVVSKQRWGVSDPPLPADLEVETKNGWGPRGTEYVLNSIGRVTGQDRDYSMAIFLRSPTGFSQGKETVNRLALTVFTALVDQL